MVSGWWFGRSQRRHLSDDTILLHIDGGLEPREDERAARHLRECWECRTKRRRLETAVAAFMEERRHEFSGLEPLHPNRDRFSARLARHAEARHSAVPAPETGPSFLLAVRRALWPLAAAAAAFAAVGVWPPVRDFVLDRTTVEDAVEAPFSRIPPRPPLEIETPPPRPAHVVPPPAVQQPSPRLEAESAFAPNLDSAELEAYLAVHELGLSRNGAVEIHRMPGEAIVVTGVVDDPARAREIEARLGPVAPVRVNLRTLEGEGSATLPLDSSGELLDARPPLLEDLLKEHFRRSAPKNRAGAEMAEFSNSVIRLAASAYVEARSIRTLASVFPSRRVQSMTATERARLSRVVAEHLDEFRQAVSKLGLLLGRLDSLTANLPDSGVEVAPLPGDWDAQMERFASRIDYLAAGLFAGLDLRGLDAEAAWAELAHAHRTLEHWLNTGATEAVTAWLASGDATATSIDPQSR